MLPGLIGYPGANVAHFARVARSELLCLTADCAAARRLNPTLLQHAANGPVATAPLSLLLHCRFSERSKLPTPTNSSFQSEDFTGIRIN